ncbi:hypothetical protein DFAR_3180018 [Desulfarculales bacterium]
MHTITQFQGDSKQPRLPPQYTEFSCLWPPGSWPEAIWPASLSRTCRPISCTISKSQTSNRTSSSGPAVTAIQQGFGSLFRRANHLARGAFIAAAEEQAQTVSPEYARIAAAELI